MKRFLLLIMLCLCTTAAFGQRYSISGNVYIDGTKKPIGWAVVTLAELNLWAVADETGYFKIENIQKGDYTFQVSCLGYVPYETKFNVVSDFTGVVINLKADNLTIAEVTVTAKASTSSMSTTRTIEKTAIDHLQMVNVSDIGSLLPGGATRNPNLMTNEPFALREGPLTAGLSSFGTAVEVDGVRLSTNADFGDPEGASTRNIATTNVESIEVITGIPSVQYGDMTSGMVRIKTERGRTPYRVTLASNPFNKQVSASKGFGIGNSVLNTSFEHTQAIKKPTSPYERYMRNSLTLNYSTTFRQASNTPIHFDVGVTGNLGGMNTEDDPDAFTGAYEKARDNALRFSTGLNWQLNKRWITNVEFRGTLLYEDKQNEINKAVTTSTEGVAVNSAIEGYYIANSLPLKYEALSFNDSKPLEYNVELKANWSRRFDKVMNRVLLGAAWKSSGNLGEGTYYDNPALQAHEFRPRPYTDIPFMNNLAVYLEDNITLPLGKTSLSVVAGLRAEQTFIKNSKYDNTSSLSPRFNARWTVVDKRRSDELKFLSFRAGWGIVEKLPSFNILYPAPDYTDRQVFAQSYDTGKNTYVFHTRPHSIGYNDGLQWMRNNNIDAGIEMEVWHTRVSLTGFYNKTLNSYYVSDVLSPYQYRISEVPSGYTVPSNFAVHVDSRTGEVYISDKDNPLAGATLMDTKLVDSTFVKTRMPANNAPVYRAGAELTIDFPQIRPIRTSIRLDASYTYAKYLNSGLSYYHSSSGHSSGNGGSFQYAAIFPNTSTSSGTYNGAWSDEWRANLTVTTHIPSVRMIVSLRVEGMLYSRSQNLSEVNGKTLAYAVDGNNNPTGKDIYSGDVATALWPYYYMDTKGRMFRFTQESADDPVLQRLIRYSANALSYNEGGYDSYFLANLSVTKEIGDLASISFYANNFTNMRRGMTNRGHRVTSVLGAGLYYGLTLRLKF